MTNRYYFSRFRREGLTSSQAWRLLCFKINKKKQEAESPADSNALVDLHDSMAEREQRVV